MPNLIAQRDNGTVNPKAWTYSGFSLTVKSSLTRTSAAGTRGISIDKNSNTIDVDGATKVRQYSAFTNTVKTSFSDGSAGTNLWDITIDNNTKPMAVDFGNSKNKKYTGFSSTIASSFATSGATPRGCTWDGTNYIQTHGANPGKFFKFSGFTSTLKTSFGTGANTFHGSEWDKFTDRFPAAAGGAVAYPYGGLILMGVGT